MFLLSLRGYAGFCKVKGLPKLWNKVSIKISFLVYCQ